jgi:hypothetical protein
LQRKRLLPSEKKRRTASAADPTKHFIGFARHAGAAYLGCVRVTEVSDTSNIKVVFFDPWEPSWRRSLPPRTSPI